MADKTRIGILGIGAVGGYFGGLLAHRYRNSPDVEIIFITKPSSEKIIKEKGLRLITPDHERIVHPHQTISNPGSLEPLDFLICAVKSYDLEESLSQLKDCVIGKTILLPLLNGVDASERIKKVLPSADVIEGCVYLVSRLMEPGIVKETGNVHSLYFGSETADIKRLKHLEKIFSEAGIECYLSENIRQNLWQKFFFTAGMANMTSYLDMNIGSVLADTGHKKMIVELLKELKKIADTKGIVFSENIIESTMTKMEGLTPGTTSSMHSDFQKGGRTEYRSITEYITELGDQLNIKTPLFDKILTHFKNKSH